MAMLGSASEFAVSVRQKPVPGSGVATGTVGGGPESWPGGTEGGRGQRELTFWLKPRFGAFL